VVTETAHDAALITRFFGLSTAPKPASAMVGATFLETDTQKMFVYDGAAWVRDQSVTVVQTGELAVKVNRTTEVVLDEILVQLKIQNAHLSVVTGETLDETDTSVGVR
jgi:hypothetical protein